MRTFISLMIALASVAAEAAPLRYPTVLVMRGYTIIWESIHANGVVQSNETITVSISLQNVGTQAVANVTATLVAGNGITPVTTEQSYGTIGSRQTPTTRDFTFTVAGPEPRIAQAKLLLSNGAASLGEVVFDVPVGAYAKTFSSWGEIDLPADPEATMGPGSVYPSIINVQGVQGTIVSARLTLHHYSHEFGEDVNAMLISPVGTNILLMSDCGGFYGFTNVNLTFDSTLTNLLPTADQLQSGTYSATDYNPGNEMAPPAPSNLPLGSQLGFVKRTNPNGNWQLYLYDARLADVGWLHGGWSLSIVSLPPPRLAVRNNNDGRVRITISGLGQRSFNVEYSTNLVDWLMLGQISGAADPATVFDSAAHKGRFYRARRNTP